MPTLVLFDTLANILFCIVVLAVQNLRKKNRNDILHVASTLN